MSLPRWRTGDNIVLLAPSMVSGIQRWLSKCLLNEGGIKGDTQELVRAGNKALDELLVRLPGRQAQQAAGDAGLRTEKRTELKCERQELCSCGACGQLQMASTSRRMRRALRTLGKHYNVWSSRRKDP